MPRKNIKLMAMAAGLFAGSLAGFNAAVQPNVVAESCPELKIVFARGSGGTRWEDQNYLTWREAIESKLKLTTIDYEFIDLDYPAVGIGVDNLSVTLGAAIGAGDSYEFGASVNAGVAELTKMVNNSCANTKYVIGGYSQGAMVVSKALGDLNAERVIYAATFGDPKIYLPEGKSTLALTSGKNFTHTGTIPAACKNENLSDYRAYVPDCYAYEGLLGSYRPYQPSTFSGKLGTWCNKTDLFCSSYLSIASHVAYVSDNLYEDAAKVIFDKITTAFKIENAYRAAHDTAILIDSTGSMANMIQKYKSEALRLARETLESGGRVALYDYRDVGGKYQPVEHCNFETCDLATFEAELEKIKCANGGDEKESLLSAAFHVMKTLKWSNGATKSLVALTDAGYHNPDLDGVTFDQVVRLSKEIDPVNFYIITKDSVRKDYLSLATATDGKVVTVGDDLSLLTDEIMERFDSLPRVEEESELVGLPELEVLAVDFVGDTSVRVKFQTDGTGAIATVNDTLCGVISVADGTGEVVVNDLDLSVENVLNLTPINDTRRGTSVKVVLNQVRWQMEAVAVPNTGRL